MQGVYSRDMGRGNSREGEGMHAEGRPGPTRCKRSAPGG